MTRKIVEDIKSAAPRDVRRHILDKKNVHTVGIGFEQKGGKSTGNICITATVSKKEPLKDLNAEDIVPFELNGVTVDVEEFEQHSFDANLGTDEDLQRKARNTLIEPLAGGIYGGNPEAPSAATLPGTAKFIDAQDGDTVSLTNRHVVTAIDDSKGDVIGDTVIQPTDKFKPGIQANRKIGTVKKVGDFDTDDSTNNVDAALIKHDESEVALSNFYYGLGKQREIAEPELGRLVTSISGKTGLTSAVIIQVDSSSRIPGPKVNGEETQIPLDGVFRYTSTDVSDGGDSGSAVGYLDENGDVFPIGLHFAAGSTGTREAGVAHSLSYVQSRLETQLIVPTGPQSFSTPKTSSNIRLVEVVLYRIKEDKDGNHRFEYVVSNTGGVRQTETVRVQKTDRSQEDAGRDEDPDDPSVGRKSISELTVSTVGEETHTLLPGEFETGSIDVPASRIEDSEYIIRTENHVDSILLFGSEQSGRVPTVSVDSLGDDVSFTFTRLVEESNVLVDIFVQTKSAQEQVVRNNNEEEPEPPLIEDKDGLFVAFVASDIANINVSVKTPEESIVGSTTNRDVDIRSFIENKSTLELNTHTVGGAIATEDYILEVSGTYEDIVGSTDQGFILAVIDSVGQTTGRFIPVEDDGSFDEQVDIFLPRGPEAGLPEEPPGDPLAVGPANVLALGAKTSRGVTASADSSDGRYDAFEDEGIIPEDERTYEASTYNFSAFLDKLNNQEYTGEQDSVTEQILFDLVDASFSDGTFEFNDPTKRNDDVFDETKIEIQEPDLSVTSTNAPVPQNGELLIEGSSNRHPDVVSIFARIQKIVGLGPLDFDDVPESRRRTVDTSTASFANLELRENKDGSSDWSIVMPFGDLSEKEQLEPGIYTLLVSEFLQDGFSNYNKSKDVIRTITITERLREDFIRGLRVPFEELDELSILPTDTDIGTKTAGAISDNVDANLYIGGKNGFPPLVWNVVEMKVEMSDVDTPNYATGVVSPNAKYDYDIQLAQEQGKKQGSVSLNFEERPEEVQREINKSAASVGLPIEENEGDGNVTGTTQRSDYRGEVSAQEEYLTELAQDIIVGESVPDINDETFETIVNAIREEADEASDEPGTSGTLSDFDLSLLAAAERQSKKSIADVAEAILTAYFEERTSPDRLAPNGVVDIDRIRALEGVPVSDQVTDANIRDAFNLLTTFSEEKTINVETKSGSQTLWGQPAILTVKTRLVSENSDPKEEIVLMRGNVANISISGDGLFSILLYDPSQQPFEDLKNQEDDQTKSFINTTVDFDQLRLETQEVSGESRSGTETFIQPAKASTVIEEILTNPQTIGFRKSRGIVNIIDSPDDYGSYKEDPRWDPATTQYVIELVNIQEPPEPGEEINSDEPTAFAERRAQQFIEEGLFATEESALDAAIEEQQNIAAKDSIITLSESGTTFYTLLQRLEKECFAEYWFDKDGVFHFGLPNPKKYRLDLITESEAALETPPYRSVRVVGSKPVGRAGKRYSSWTQLPEDSEKVEVTATIGRIQNLAVAEEEAGVSSENIPEQQIVLNETTPPVYEYIDYSLTTEEQIISVARSLIKELIKKNASGDITVVGLPEIELFDIVRLPNSTDRPLGGAEYSVTKVTHELSGKNGYITRIGVAAPDGTTGELISASDIETVDGNYISFKDEEVESPELINESPPEEQENNSIFGFLQQIADDFTNAVTDTVTTEYEKKPDPPDTAIDRDELRRSR